MLRSHVIHRSAVALSILVLFTAACSERRSGGGTPTFDGGRTDGAVTDGMVAVDSGTDAGGTDAGPSDAGTDAGPMDAGPTDAGADTGVDAAMDAGMDAGGMCPDMDAMTMTGIGILTGNTAGATDDHTMSCGFGSSPDIAISWAAPAAGTYTFDTIGSSFDTVLTVRDGTTCAGAELGCNDDNYYSLDSTLRLTLTAGQMVVIVIDGYDGDAGAFTLSITTGAPDTEVGLCGNMIDDDRDGEADCGDYDDCNTDPICTETNCSNGVDDDMDGDTDCFDYDCSMDPACMETNCSNGADDDMDGAVDCLDSDCFADPACP